jgi:hypothetical protein
LKVSACEFSENQIRKKKKPRQSAGLFPESKKECLVFQKATGFFQAGSFYRKD